MGATIIVIVTVVCSVLDVNAQAPLQNSKFLVRGGGWGTSFLAFTVFGIYYCTVVLLEYATDCILDID